MLLDSQEIYAIIAFYQFFDLHVYMGVDLKVHVRFQHQTARKLFPELAKEDFLFATVSRKLFFLNHDKYTI